ncbi:hypothetical protein BZA05DRAFT_389340 [Tricharina praecox]|uniref:uncharacterized protein n=1 Tax=Tricharina praecox TaxID=43433 RepID=UPI00221E8F67|nr:uncharacterized protein BZA05DRAFT_389340 [Tricharina praecox]KAI5855682.1 hypothetical protein BZA05DRAFT_389340 [Tricharina praecox]
MSTHSDGEDSQMHDNASLPSSTPSTPPASSHHPGGIPTSPPGSQQQAGPGPATSSASGLAHDRMTGLLGLAGQGQTGQAGQNPTWAGKRAQEEADHAKERCVDKVFAIRWLGDPFDESDMWKV